MIIGCHCWFDPLEKFLGKNKCACCKNDGVQCGYPKHKWCQPKVNNGEIQLGCKGEIRWNSFYNVHNVIE